MKKKKFRRQLLTQLGALSQQFQSLSTLVPPTDSPPDWSSLAFRWCRADYILPHRYLAAIDAPALMPLDDLLGIERQKAALVANIQQFLIGAPANHILLTGSRGVGKSSLARALLHTFAKQGLRLIEVDKSLLVDIPSIVQQISGRSERFLLYCDDLSFDVGEDQYKALKVALEGSLLAMPDNLLIMATSNRRHLMPEFMSENRPLLADNGEIHPNESSEEKIALSERFGLWLNFSAFDQDTYLSIVEHWLVRLGSPTPYDQQVRQAALQWALQRGARSGRIAVQFARHFVGQCLLAQSEHSTRSEQSVLSDRS